jgi:hypothetical protein
MRSTLTITIPVIFFMGIGMAKAAVPTLLAETGGFLLGNARRCGVPIERIERAGKVIHDFIAIAANDPNQAAAADRRFAEIFLASALPEPNPRALPSCEVVRQQFERLERHHEEARKSGGTPAASPSF